MITAGFVLGQAEKEGRQGGWANGDVVHFIAGINDEYNKIAFIDQASVVQRLDSAIHRINHYPVDSAISFHNTYQLESDLSSG